MGKFDLFDMTVDYIRSLPGGVQFDALYLISGDTDEFDITCAAESVDEFYSEKTPPMWLEVLSHGDKDSALSFLKSAVMEHKMSIFGTSP